MKKFILMAALMFSGGAFAQQQAEPAGCKLAFHVKINSFLIFSQGHGTGRITCSDAEGKVTAKSKVAIAIDGIGLGLGTFDLRGISGSVGVNDPTELVGTYAVAEANIGAGPAIGAALGFVGQESGLSFTGQVNAGTGIGVFINGTRWIIELL